VIIGRRAERFHALVAAGQPAAGPSSYAELLEVVGALRAVPAPVADPVFVATLREQLVAEAESILAEAAAARDDQDARLRLVPSSPHARRRHRRLAAAVSGAVLVGGTATLAVAAQSALPGDSLYPVKRGIENTHAELTFDKAARGRLLLSNASTRLDEVSELSRVEGGSPQVSPTLDAFTQQAVEGSQLLVEDYQATRNPSSISAVRTFTATSMARLRDLQSAVPHDSLPQLLQAAQALEQIHQTSAQACPTCAGPDVTSIPQVLTQSVQAATDSFSVALPGPHHAHRPGGLQLPHVGGSLPPASVTDPSGSAPGDTPTATTATPGEVHHTIQHLTSGLTDGQQHGLGNTVADTAGNVLDAVGQVGNTVTGAVGNTIGGITSALPSIVPGLP
jgi:hypothetical protein